MDMYIMRGLPGAGKSTVASQISEATGAFIASADHFFIGPDGEYRFDPNYIADAHASCKANALAAVKRGQRVVIDNTNTQEWEYRAYKEMAEEAGYTILVISVFDGGLTDAQLAERNTHGVPVASIAKMRERWEKDPIQIRW